VVLLFEAADKYIDVMKKQMKSENKAIQYRLLKKPVVLREKKIISRRINRGTQLISNLGKQGFFCCLDFNSTSVSCSHR